MDIFSLQKGSLLIVRQGSPKLFAFKKDMTGPVQTLDVGAYLISRVLSVRDTAADIEILLNGEKNKVIVTQDILDSGDITVADYVEALSLDESHDLIHRFIRLVMQSNHQSW